MCLFPLCFLSPPTFNLLWPTRLLRQYLCIWNRPGERVGSARNPYETGTFYKVYENIEWGSSTRYCITTINELTMNVVDMERLSSIG